jgi:hypothetical protein
MRRNASLFTDTSANRAQYGLKAGRDKSIVTFHIVYSHPNSQALTKEPFLRIQTAIHRGKSCSLLPTSVAKINQTSLNRPTDDTFLPLNHFNVYWNLYIYREDGENSKYLYTAM